MGFLTQITNPKGIAFFLGLFAAAIPATAPLWVKISVLLVGGSMEVSWYSIVTFALTADRILAGYRKLQRTIDRTFGALLVAVGLKIAFDVV
jgi:threonine efflux protein